MKKVLVIGGGISGITVAYQLYKSGLDVTLLEKEDRAGGSIHTEKDSGYLIECGPNSTLDLYKEADDLCEDLRIMGEKIFGDKNAKNRYVVRDGKLRPLPTGPMQFLTTDLWSIRGKLRLMGEPFVRKSGNACEESIAQFVIRRTGQEFLDYALDPFVTGVFAGDPYRLSLKSCFPKMYALEQEYGGLVKGALFGRKKRSGPGRKMRLFSFKDGLVTLPAAISRALGSRFVGGCKVLSVKKTTDGFEVTAENPMSQRLTKGNENPTCHPELVSGSLGKEILKQVQNDREAVFSDEKNVRIQVFKADTVILATPAWITARLIHPLSELISAILSRIEYVPITIVFTGFDKSHIKHPLDGFGFLIPSKEATAKGYNILGSIWSSAIFPGRAPEGKTAFTNMLGGARMSDVFEHSDSELADMTLHDLRHILGINEKPDFLRVIRHPRAIPQYTIGHQERINCVEKALKNIPELYLAGNYINGISVGHCIAEATKLVREILQKG